MRRPSPGLVAGLLAGSLTLTAGCAADAPGGDITAGQLDRDATPSSRTGFGSDPATVLLATSAGSCATNRDTVSTGQVDVVIANDGDTATAIEVRDANGRVLAERTGIDPGTSAELDVDLPPGDYRIACLPDGANERAVTLRASGNRASASPTVSDPPDAASP